ncbi:hypothetical protein BOTBODRAFT_37975 [Botryobasidium botryosum FD-172 SS1]|uniref:FAD-binding domain-containing protein n=1 Tax=Botryobasidium botryosum (strain FD-172 SS1) TaxID=930990 RepID=A0A067M984_BOTB1|nr:hypothetical protein BOTBODRAFT_37975 [Botryobasidium botryosum FD-172 SS1]
MDTLKSSNNATAVLIVGAGPAGLTAALTLAKNNIPVRIIEKNSEFEVRARGAGIYQRTLEVFASLGAIGPIIKNGLPIHAMRAYGPNGRDILKTWNFVEAVEPRPDIPYPSHVIYPQDGTEAALRDTLKEHGVTVELSTELTAFEQDENGVTAHIISRGTSETVRANWLIGTDGGRSVVRKGLSDVSFLGETQEERTTIIADIHVEDFDRDFWHVWSNAQGGRTVIYALHPSPRYTFFLIGDNVDASKEVMSGNLEAFQKMFNSAAGRDDLKVSKINFISKWRPNIRMVNKFSVGRVFLAGDAAHTHSPTGGQGLNTSVQDAHNLGWKLALVHKEIAHPSLLSTYSKERMPVVAEMLNLTTELYTAVYGREGSARAALSEKSDTQAWERGEKLNGLGVNCRWSPIVVDERTVRTEGEVIEAYGVRGGIPRAGDRAPEAPGLIDIANHEAPTTSLFKLFGPNHHTALVFSAGNADFESKISDELNSYNVTAPLVVPVLVLPKGSQPSHAGAPYKVVEDKEGHARAGYYIKSDDDAWVVIVRPDGVIGAIVKGSEGIEKYFSAIFVASP